MLSNDRPDQRDRHRFRWTHQFGAFTLVLSLLLGGCRAVEEEPMSGGRGEALAEMESPVTVDVAIVQTRPADDEPQYTGTTQPARTVSAKSRVDGQVLELSVDAGDVVVAGQVLARIDDRLLLGEVDEADAELGARVAEVEKARFDLAETRARVAEAIVERDRARADAGRFEQLAKDGAVPQQQADLERAAFETAEQTVFAIEEQVSSRERTIATAEQRVAAQAAIVERTRERLSYATVISPLDGVVLDRVAESGDVVRIGDALVELGDFSTVQVRIEVADRDRDKVELGQPVEVSLDAFPGRGFEGRIARIFPIADPVARLIPVEITLSDPSGLVSGGLLARVGLASQSKRQTVTIPRSALEVSEAGGSVVVVVEGSARETKAIARSVTLVPAGEASREQTGDTVEIKSGLVPGDAYIVRSAKPLQDGQVVRRSFLSD
jgi:HlyD family secretion protein